MDHILKPASQAKRFGLYYQDPKSSIWKSQSAKMKLFCDLEAELWHNTFVKEKHIARWFIPFPCACRFFCNIYFIDSVKFFSIFCISKNPIFMAHSIHQFTNQTKCCYFLSVQNHIQTQMKGTISSTAPRLWPSTESFSLTYSTIRCAKKKLSSSLSLHYSIYQQLPSFLWWSTRETFHFRNSFSHVWISTGIWE